MALYEYSLVACARWETETIAEWLTYHASLGFEHVYLYCNDDDPTDLYTAVLPFLSGPAPFVTFWHYPIQGQQRAMYLHFLQTAMRENTWIMFLDIDEFVYLAKDRSIGEFQKRKFGASTNVGAIYFNWLMFGNNFHVERPRGSVIENYTRHAAVLHPYTKVMVRTENIDPYAVMQQPQHFWHDWPSAGFALRRVNVLGQEMDTYYENFPDAAQAAVARPDVTLAIKHEAMICHFSLQSEADFERRAARGLGGEFGAQITWLQHKQSGHHQAILDQINAVEFFGLRDRWRALHTTEAISAVFPRSGAANLALQKPALQSSLSTWSIQPTIALDAAGVVSGRFTGTFQCHTGEDQEPWWQVDLGGIEAICEVRVFNRIGNGSFRSRHLTFSVSPDGSVWREVFRKTDDTIFGGIDGFPLRWITAPVEARFFRITLLARTFLHFDQVEIYGCT
jgi:hypothetical protein